MNRRNFLINVIRVSFSNGVKLVASILTGIFLPVVFDVSDYGYYRLFILYLSYFGLFHLGFIDGIYLKYAGKDYNELDKDKFKVFTRFIVILESIASLAVIIFAFIFMEGNRQLVFVFLGLNVFSLNITTYFQHISQITSRFKEYSQRNIINAILTILSIVILYFFKISDYKPLLLILLIISYALMIWYTFSYKYITYGKSSSINTYRSDIIDNFKLGIPLLLANLITIFILNIPKQVVDIYFDIETFAVFTFSFSMMTFANVFITALSTVVYPTLRKVSDKTLKNVYSDSISIIMVIIFMIIILYYPIDYLVINYISKYTNSLRILLIVFPSLALSSVIQIIKLNYLKRLNKVKDYLVSGLITLILSAVLSFLAYHIFGTLESIAYAYVLSMIVWYIITDVYFVKHYKIKPLKNFIYLIIMMIMFYLIVFNFDYIIGIILYLALFSLTSLLFYRKAIKKYMKMYRNERN